MEIPSLKPDRGTTVKSGANACHNSAAGKTAVPAAGLDLPLDVKAERQAGQVLMAILGVSENCPSCEAVFSPKARESYLAGRRVQCRGCGFDGNWRSATMLFRSGINNSRFLLLFGKFVLPDDDIDLAKALGITVPTVRQWRKRIHESRGIK